MENNIRIISLVIVFFIISCKKNESSDFSIQNPNKDLKSFEEKLYNRIDIFLDSANCKKNKVIGLRYQKFNKKDFVQISSQNFFVPDSLFILEEYRGHLLAVYNKEFFNKTIKYSNSKKVLNENDKWNVYKSNQNETGIPCFDMYEVINERLIKVPTESYYHNNLFKTPPMLPPPPPPVQSL